MNGPAIIGIDPGASGGIAVLDGFAVYTLKLDTTEADVCEWLRGFWLEGAFACIEAVHSMPKQGVASSFKFGKSYGFLRGLLTGLKIPFEEVTPQKWQKAMGCLSKGDKNVTKQKAQQLFPQLKITHATADCLLIAEHCRRVRMGLGSNGMSKHLTPGDLQARLCDYVTRAEYNGVAERNAQLHEAMEMLARGLLSLSRWDDRFGGIAHDVLECLDLSEPTINDEPGQGELF